MSRVKIWKKLWNIIMLVFTTSANCHITRLLRGLKRDHILSAWKLGKKGSKYTRKQTTFTESKPLRFFCREDNYLEQLLEPSTVHERSCSKVCYLLGDKHLIAKLSSCDLVAQETKYHARLYCLLSLFNKAWNSENNQSDSHMKSIGLGIALAKLV